MKDIKSMILKIIKDNPGIRYRELLRSLGTVNGVLSYHLYMLENEDAIRVERQGGMTRYYPNSIDKREARILGMLRIPMVMKIINFMLVNDGCSLEDLALYVNRSKSTISWHMKRLVEEGIITKYDNLYYIKDKDVITKVLSKYKLVDKIDVIADNYSNMMDEFRF
jgi:predicted transcriptional regulator